MTRGRAGRRPPYRALGLPLALSLVLLTPAGAQPTAAERPHSQAATAASGPVSHAAEAVVPVGGAGAPAAQVEPAAAAPEAMSAVRLAGSRPPRQPPWRGGAVDVADLVIPSPALSAYRLAADTMAAAAPRCRLPWTLLAAIGKVESDHGRRAGSVLDAAGVSLPPVRGPRLDGPGRRSTVEDTDGGRVDGDRRWDRAVGPLQLLPTTWSVVAVDGDADGRRDADDVDDAALAVGVLLCASGEDLGSAGGRRRAVTGHQRADGYADLVLDLESAYRRNASEYRPEPAGSLQAWMSSSATTSPAVHSAVGRAVVPTSPVAARADATGGRDNARRPSRPDRPGRKGPGSGEARPAGPSPAVAPAQPTPDPPAGPQPAEDPAPVTPAPDAQVPTATATAAPVPDPAPAPDGTDADSGSAGGGAEPAEPPPGVRVLTGVLLMSDGAWYVGDQVVDVGTDRLDETALADHDGDGSLESRRDELDGLAGAEVAVEVDADGVVRTVAGQEYLPTS